MGVGVEEVLVVLHNDEFPVGPLYTTAGLNSEMTEEATD